MTTRPNPRKEIEMLGEKVRKRIESKTKQFTKRGIEYLCGDGAVRITCVHQREQLRLQ
jgi:hypothetical protein